MQYIILHSGAKWPRIFASGITHTNRSTNPVRNQRDYYGVQKRITIVIIDKQLRIASQVKKRMEWAVAGMIAHHLVILGYESAKVLSANEVAKNNCPPLSQRCT